MCILEQRIRTLHTHTHIIYIYTYMHVWMKWTDKAPFTHVLDDHRWAYLHLAKHKHENVKNLLLSCVITFASQSGFSCRQMRSGQSRRGSCCHEQAGLFMYVCMYVFVYVCLKVYCLSYVRNFAGICVCVCVFFWMCVYPCVYVYCVHVYVFMYVHMYAKRWFV